MVGVRRSTANSIEFYKLKERGGGGGGVKDIISSAWASKEDLAHERNGSVGSGCGRGSGSGSGSGRGMGVGLGTVTWSEDEIPLKGIRVKNVVEVDTRDDSGGALSPV